MFEKFYIRKFRRCQEHLIINKISDSVTNHKDKEYSHESMLVYGNGDGGGGPLESMIERLQRMEDVDGLPKVKFGNPNDFFSRVQHNSPDLIEWKGELVCLFT
jgi:alpha-mannosidase